jgi:hypothetical protein
MYAKYLSLLTVTAPQSATRARRGNVSAHCMNRQEKTHHHFVPQVYLKKFHHTIELKGRKKNYFVSAFDKSDNDSKNKISVKDICAKKRLYTVDSPNINVRESIENFYANTIEKDYNKFYDLLTKSSVDKITLKERELIVSTMVNLHLRNYFWLKIFNDFWTSVINKYPEGFTEKIYDEDNNILFDFSSQTRGQVIDESKKSNKQVFIKSHLEQTVKWTKYHYHDFIIVDKIPNEKDRYITSDKPVIGGTINSSLRLTLDSKHMLTLISPQADIPSRDDQIHRQSTIVHPDEINIMHYENSERLVIGYDLKDLHRAKSNYEKTMKR